MAHRVLVVSVLLTLAAPLPSHAQSSPRIRVLDPVLKVLFDRGMELSPTFRALVERVEATPILVFIEGDIRMPARIGARLGFVTSVNGLRYVRVEVDCTLSPRRQIALLAHELQHALEIGERTDILDAESMELLYEDIGFQSFDSFWQKGFETDAAIMVQRVVDEEMGERPGQSPGSAAY